MNQLNDNDEYELDEIKGRYGARKKMAVLNKTKLTQREMDELFLGEDMDEKE
jgi:hypothetical protein